LEKNSLPITPDGCFLAYKRVRENYMDCHTGTMDNSVGRVVEMERNMVDDNRNNTCSSGLHFCSHSYLSSFGGERTVIVKIDPADVVSIPSDYNDAKGRACRYTVIGEVGRNPEDKAEFNKPVQNNASSLEPKETFPVGPKLGSTAFYRGYTDGFTGKEYDPGNYWSMTDQNNYEEGYDKGQMHNDDGIREKYRYVEKNSKVDVEWPMPNKR
jgi:hypothetical protein